MPRAKPIEDGFEPICCVKCGQIVMTRVTLTARAPMGWHNLSKDGIRSRLVKIEFADWDFSTVFCGCGPPQLPSSITPGRRKPNESLLKRERRLAKNKPDRKPGRRWTKGLVPPKPHPLTKANHPLTKAKSKTQRLTPELEAQVIELWAQGLKYKEIGVRLRLTKTAVTWAIRRERSRERDRRNR